MKIAHCGLVFDNNRCMQYPKQNLFVACHTQRPSMDERQALAQLRAVLADLYDDQASIRRIVHDAGLDGAQIAFSSRAEDSWHSILLEAKKRRRLEQIVQIATREYSGNGDLQATWAIYKNVTHVKNTEINQSQPQDYQRKSYQTASQNKETQTLPTPKQSVYPTTIIITIITSALIIAFIILQPDRLWGPTLITPTPDLQCVLIRSPGIRSTGIRSGPGFTYNIVEYSVAKEIRLDGFYVVIGVDGGRWLPIKIKNGGRGWLHSALIQCNFDIESLSTQEIQTPTLDTTIQSTSVPTGTSIPKACVTKGFSAVRTGPSIGDQSMYTLSAGEAVTPMGASFSDLWGKWVQVQTTRGVPGWVYASNLWCNFSVGDLLEIKPTPTPTLIFTGVPMLTPIISPSQTRTPVISPSQTLTP